MTPTSTGYQGPDYTDDEKKTKPPEECEWLIVQKQVGDTNAESITVYAAFECDGEVLGMITLPNPEYLRFLRERMQ